MHHKKINLDDFSLVMDANRDALFLSCSGVFSVYKKFRKIPIGYSGNFRLSHIIEHSLQGFIVKNIEGESTEENNVSHILLKWVCCVNNSKCY